MDLSSTTSPPPATTNHGNNSNSQGYTSPDRPPKKSSTTCTTCRARKVRCNGIRPVCSNCQRLGFPCSYDDDATDPAAAAAAWSMALPRRRVKQACLSCHSRKARCSGHMPSCDRCRAQGIDCVYRPTKRARVPTKSLSGGRSPQSHDGDRDRDNSLGDSDPGFVEATGPTTPTTFNHDLYSSRISHMPPMESSNHQTYSNHTLPDESFDALIGRTFEKFFRHVHHIPMFSFLHRASLMEQYHAGKVDKSLLLALVGVTSMLTDMGRGMHEYGDRCINEAEQLIFSDFARPSTFKVQALVFMIKHRVLSNRFPNAFMLLSMAWRFASALRLNYDSPQLCFLAQESRRRLVWSLYCIDAGISAGNRDYSLLRAERVFVGLPCNERNFEFDLPQETEKLVPESNEPKSEQAEDIGSLALHIRIQHIRKKISEFTKEAKEATAANSFRPSDLQTRVLSLHRELEDFAGHLPVSFQFSENSLRLRAYSPRICVFVMIHVWWRQCHCDLYRLGLIGLKEALPPTELEKFDESFIEHCQRQCVDHAMAMASIFSAMQKLNAKPVADLDLGFCAFHCAKMLRYAYHANSGKLNLSADSVMEQFQVCLQAVKECCTGPAADGIRRDIEGLISQNLGARVTPLRTMTPPIAKHGRNKSNVNTTAQNRLPNSLRDVATHVPEDTSMDSPPTSVAPTLASQPEETNFPTTASMSTTATTPSLPPALIPESWSVDIPPSDMASKPNDGFSTPNELNNAYEGAVDGLGLDNGMDFTMGIDMNMWTGGGPPSNGNGADWSGADFITGTGVGV